MSDIFISYASEDRDRAKAVAKALKAQGWSVWWDPRIRAGQKFDRAIEAALADAKCVVVLWSKHSADSDWVRAEASRGLDREILNSVCIETGTKLPLQFNHVHTIPRPARAFSPSGTLKALSGPGELAIDAGP